jgi:hypothetical protein
VPVLFVRSGEAANHPDRVTTAHPGASEPARDGTLDAAA